ncbi:MAG: hypothetical protein KC425_06665 [Anaerolineales bacterium]|nr:hypothetical protein [Anaerolineales bacterium]
MLRRWLRILGLVGIGLAAGAGLGLFLGWNVWPTEYTDAVPAIMQENYRQDYAHMIAAAYAVDGDLAAARQRVASLGEAGADFYFSVTLDAILLGQDETEIRQLARLAADLGYESPALTPYLRGENAGATP